MKKEDELCLRSWSELTKEVLEDVQADLWTAQAINKAAYKALEDKAVAGQVPDIEEQAEIMLLLEAAGDYMKQTEAVLNRFI